MLKLKGSIKISGDKSISHRALIFASLSTGKVKISNLLESDDVMRTLNILKKDPISNIKVNAKCPKVVPTYVTPRSTQSVPQLPPSDLKVLQGDASVSQSDPNVVAKRRKSVPK